MNIRNIASFLIALFLIFYLLYIGKFFFIPFSIAVVAWYIIIAMSSAYKSIKIKNFQLSHYSAILLSFLSLCLLLAILITLLNSNIGKVIELIPAYQEKFKSLSYEFLDLAGVDTSLGFRQILESFDMTGILLGATKFFTATAGYLVMIFVYTLFLLLEYRKIGKKLKQVFNDHLAYERFNQTLINIDQDIRTYLKIKTLASLSTALLSYLVLSFVGVDLAVFWSLLIFILNFIPTVGSIVAVIFPVVISLIQFESIIPFLVVLSALVLIQVSIGNILEPRYMGKSLNLSPLVIISSLALWGSIWGVVGMFLCVPIMVITNIVLAKFDKTRPVAVMLSARGKVS